MFIKLRRVTRFVVLAINRNYIDCFSNTTTMTKRRDKNDFQALTPSHE